MKTIAGESHASPELLCLAHALVVYAQSDFLRRHKATRASDPQANQRLVLKRLFTDLWPDCDIYLGHTHWRVTPFPVGRGQPSENFYVDL